MKLRLVDNAWGRSVRLVRFPVHDLESVLVDHWSRKVRVQVGIQAGSQKRIICS